MRTEDGINDMIRYFQSLREVIHEWHIQIFQLFGEPL